MSKRICVATLEDLYTKGIDVSPLTMFGSQKFEGKKIKKKSSKKEKMKENKK